MKTKKIVTKFLLLSLLVLGLGNIFTLTVFADKKATEGQNEADVEFYEPTPKKPGPKPKPKPKSQIDPVSKLLPKTGETNMSFVLVGVGTGMLSLAIILFLTSKKVGGRNEN